MAFPQTPLPVKVELSLNGTWTDVTADVRSDSQVRITRGRSNWATAVEAGQCSFALSDTDGKYSPRNPAGAYYGQIGRNTPVRVSVGTGSVALALPGADADYATTADTAALDVTGDIDVRLDATLLNWYLADSAQGSGSTSVLTELIGKYNTTGNQRSWVLYTQYGFLQFAWSTDGTSTNNITATSSEPLPVPSSGRLAVRATLDVNDGAGGLVVRFYTAPTISGPWKQLGEPATGAFTTSIYSSTANLIIGNAIGGTDSSSGYMPALGRVHAAQVRNGIDGTAVANPDFTAQTSGTTSFADSAGRTWTLAGAAEITNRKTRFVGEVSSWTPEWDTGGFDAVCRVEASGVLRRMGAGAVPAKSPMYREFTSPSRTGIVAYWPMEDGADSIRLASAFNGHQPITIIGTVTPAAYSDWAASDPICTVGTGSLRATVPDYTGGTYLFLRVFAAVPAAGVVSTQRLLSFTQSGTAVKWSLYLNTSGDLDLRAYDSTDTQILSTGFAGTHSINGKQKSIGVELTQSGSNVHYRLFVYDVQASTRDTASFTSTSGDLASYTVGRATAVRFGEDGAMNGTAIGHLAISNSNTGFSSTTGALLGWDGETAAARVHRLGLEESITAYATAPGDEKMGVQARDTIINLVRAAGDVDEGILAEQRDVLGLRLVQRTSLYNQEPALTLNYAGSDGLVAPLQPTEDDQALTNDVTVARSGGSSARVTQGSGPLSTAAPPNGVGVYDGSYTLGLYDDAQPARHAAWRLHLGTWDETRFPTVTVNLAAAPASIDSAAGVDVGSRIQITNPPVWLPPGPLDLLVVGTSETLDQYTWTIDYNCTPAGPWTVGARATVEGFEATTYEVVSADGGSLPWTRTTAHFNSGATSLRSGAITNNQTSDWVVTVPGGSTEMRFWYYTSSEAAGAGFEGDRLLVLVDSTQVLRAQGTTPWTQAVVDVTGASTVTFRYAKDNSTAVGDDAVYIDDLSFTGRPPTRRDTAGSALAAGATSTALSLSVSTTSGPLWTTDSVDFPFNILVGGEEMTVTAISGASSPQTFTIGTRSVNGVVKAQTTGATVALAQPAVRAL